MNPRSRQLPELARPDTALLRDASSGLWLLFTDPVESFLVRKPSEIRPALEVLEASAVSRGLYAVAWLSYEAGAVFDDAYTVCSDGSFPLAGIAAYREPIRLTALPSGKGASREIDWKARISEEQYRQAVAVLRAHLACGNSYQVNFSFALEAALSLPPEELFLDMIAAQPEGYGAFVNLSDWAVCSASPELFYSLEGSTILSKPMKGTAARAPSVDGDLAARVELQGSGKAHAENIMIVDMVRNDLSKVARVGTVAAPVLFSAERYPTLWQLTSTVTAETDASLFEIFRALYPAASITGAPKAKTMEIIKDLEGEPRRIYTGTIGFVTPARRAQFNVAIRTVLVDKISAVAEYRVGSGIVWDSDTGAEYSECLTKARVLTAKPPEFDLFETFGWDPEDGFINLDRHLQRIAQSAEYFGRPFADGAALEQLLRLSTSWRTAMRVKLSVGQQGEFRTEAEPLRALSEPYLVRPAKHPVDSSNVYLFHKTTNRSVYEEALLDADGADDVILFNERGEITESCIANILVELSGSLYTPPLSCGCLPGVGRAMLLEQGIVAERTLSVEEFEQASAILLVNSLRGVWKAQRLGQMPSVDLIRRKHPADSMEQNRCEE